MTRSTTKDRKLSPQKMALYDVAWQAMRVSFLGKWNTPEGAADNLARLIKYIEHAHNGTDGDEVLSRLWRGLNLLNAVRMGYSGQGLTGSDMDQSVVRVRNMISKFYHDVKKRGYKFKVPTRREVEAAWPKISEETRQLIKDNLGKRQALHALSEYRDELGWFLATITQFENRKEEVVDGE